jgi:radical SAM/Cys-rich protein
MPLPTLHRQGSPLAEPAHQLRLLDEGGHPPFAQTLADSGLGPLRAAGIQVLQVNVGKLCNQTCRHCHVDAGPERREVMSRATMALCLDVLARAGIPTLDVTGGAPEMNPHFRWLVGEARKLGRHVIDRCNLTILLTPGHDDLPEFLADMRVEIVASLPCYLAENTDAQRGSGVFEKSITALRRLNALGYGRPDTGLVLTLVYNPLGPHLPPPQAGLEAAYRRELAARYGVTFNRLYTLTNMPISRFLDDLVLAGRLGEYMTKLVAAYNPDAVTGLMCHTTLSVGWDGRLYDCDFNQMLDLDLAPGLPRHIRDFDAGALAERRIATGQHCYGCTAGSGSGCQGAIVHEPKCPGAAR